MGWLFSLWVRRQDDALVRVLARFAAPHSAARRQVAIAARPHHGQAGRRVLTQRPPSRDERAPVLRLGSLHGAHAVTVTQRILSSAFGLVALPPIYFAYVGGVTVCYPALVEVVKRRTMLPALA